MIVQCNTLLKVCKPHDRQSFTRKSAERFDIAFPGSTLEMIRMPLIAPDLDFARLTSRIYPPREIPDDSLDGIPQRGND